MIMTNLSIILSDSRVVQGYPGFCRAPLTEYCGKNLIVLYSMLYIYRQLGCLADKNNLQTLMLGPHVPEIAQ